ncbi:MAG: DUF4349 domain-containing protein [Ferruginibacter sp.]
MKKLFFSMTMLLLLFFISCNNAHNDGKEKMLAELQPVNADTARSYETDQQVPLPASQSLSTDSVAKMTPSKVPVSNDWDNKIIKTASLKIEVPDFKKYNDAVYKTVKQYGGYIAQEDQSLTTQKNETSITIKVPVYQFETMMNELPGSDTKVLERKINTDDVTRKIIDTKSRLETKKEMRLKYLEMMKQSKNITDITKAQQEVDDVQEEIEAASGQVNYLSHETAFSTINLNFYQLMADYKPADTEKQSFLTRVSIAFKSGAGWIANLIIGLMSIWPLLLIIFIALFVWKKIRLDKFFAATKTTSPKS